MAICDTTSWNSPRNLENLPGFLEKFSENPTKLWSASKKNGAPHTIIVAGAGLRAADLARYIFSVFFDYFRCLTPFRVLRKFQAKDAAVAKLFAKHIKIKDAIKFLQSMRTGMAVGTPIRLNDLMDKGISHRFTQNFYVIDSAISGALAIDKLERIVIDASYVDQKRRG